MLKEFVKNTGIFFVCLLALAGIVSLIICFVVPWIESLEDPYRFIATIIGIMILLSIFGGALSILFYKPEEKDKNIQGKNNS